ncbi:MAG: aminotransferase class V-fold PLP-dependent enzyme [Clostridia bacterium]|nr:aminotransferase class V-fold PLP-dependent enzyme [Clostridia bacterium]
MIYFDNAATSFPKSGKVIKAASDAMRKCGNPGRSGHAPAMRGAEAMFSCREKAARIFGTEPERVILVPSCTAALNMAIKGYGKGKRIIISNMEHNAVCRPAYAMRAAGECEISFFNAFAKDAVSEFASKLGSSSVAAFSHGSNVCGKLLPLAGMLREARSRGVFTIIDAAQTAGHAAISFDQCDADIICCAGHKGLGGPTGTGLMLINRRVKELPRTILEGGTGVYSLDEWMPDFFPERLEPGTPGVAAFAGLSAALDEFTLEFDLSPFDLLCAELSYMKNVTLHGLCPRRERLPVLLFNVKGRSCEEVMRLLAARDICVRSGFHCAPLAHRALGTLSGGVRVSLGRKNTKKEIKRFCYELKKIASSV